MLSRRRNNNCSCQRDDNDDDDDVEDDLRKFCLSEIIVKRSTAFANEELTMNYLFQLR
jgi:hypothetical protein